MASNKTLKRWPKLVSYFLQMNVAKAEVCQCIIFKQVLNKQSSSPLNGIDLHACFH